MKYYIDGGNKEAILKIWNTNNEVFVFRIVELKDGKITIVKELV